MPAGAGLTAGILNDHGLEFQRRPGHAAAAGPGAGPGRAARLPGARHVDHGDEPSLRRSSRRSTPRPRRPSSGCSASATATASSVRPGRRLDAVRDGADELPAAGRDGRLPGDRRLGGEGVRGGGGARPGTRARPRPRRTAIGACRARRDRPQPRRRLRPPHLERDDPGHPVARASPTSATGRSSPT